MMRTAAGAKPAAEPAADPHRLRTQAPADARRELVLEAARSAFFEPGMDQTSIRAIAQRAGPHEGS